MATSTMLVVYISTDSCQDRAFRCSNGQCIYSGDRCDGTQDCTDGSDESGCGKSFIGGIGIPRSTHD